MNELIKILQAYDMRFSVIVESCTEAIKIVIYDYSVEFVIQFGTIELVMKEDTLDEENFQKVVNVFNAIKSYKKELNFFPKSIDND